LEAATRSFEAEEKVHIRVGARSHTPEIRNSYCEPQAGDDGDCRDVEGPQGSAGYRTIRTAASEGQTAKENLVLISILIDSDILIEVSRGRDQDIFESWREVAESEIVPLCSPVSVAERWHGAFPQERVMLRELFATMPCVPIDLEIGERAGEYLRQFAKSHNVELGDALIAATAVLHNAKLWTRNRRHYPMKEILFY
jgi:predicted nucleic acid-binding protein